MEAVNITKIEQGMGCIALSPEGFLAEGEVVYIHKNPNNAVSVILKSTEEIININKREHIFITEAISTVDRGFLKFLDNLIALKQFKQVKYLIEQRQSENCTDDLNTELVRYATLNGLASGED